MAAFITELMKSFDITKMWDVIVSAGVLIGTLIIFGFGYRVVRRLISGARSGKAKL
jgi:hypothetical protein